MERFKRADHAYLAWLAQHPKGYVLNTYDPPSPSYLMLHHATCKRIGGTPPRGRHWTSYPKFCAEDLSELGKLASSEGRGVATPCTYCHPGP